MCAESSGIASQTAIILLLSVHHISHLWPFSRGQYLSKCFKSEGRCEPIQQKAVSEDETEEEKDRGKKRHRVRNDRMAISQSNSNENENIMLPKPTTALRSNFTEFLDLHCLPNGLCLLC